MGHEQARLERAQGGRLRDEMDKLVAEGFTDELAHAVALGRLTREQAVARMARASEAEWLISHHRLDRSVAFQVLQGQIPLEKVLQQRRFVEQKARGREHDPLADAVGQSRWVRFVDGREKVAQIVSVDRYHTVLRDENAQAHQVHKLELALLAPAADAKRIKKAIRRVPAKDAVPAEVASHPAQRFRVSDRRLFGLVEARLQVQVTLVGGDTLQGVVRHFSRYAFELEVKTSQVVTVFRHALAALDSVAR